MKLVQPKPPKFQEHSYRFEFTVNQSRQDVWNWLNRPETFTDTQIPPFRVEFYSPSPDIPNGFHEGVLNTHHGPLINFSGVLTSIQPPHYRDLQYYYGSYAISIRWIRPYRLQFWLEESDGSTTVVAQIDSYVKPWISGLWTTAQKVFWSRFPSWARRSVSRLKKKKVTS
jgi:hypothetical protein